MGGGHEDGVEVVGNVVTEGNEDLDGSVVVLHGQLDGTAGQGPCCAVTADGVLAAAGKGAELVLIESTGWRVVEGEVGGSEGGEGDED